MASIQPYGLDISTTPKITQLEIELLFCGTKDPESKGGISPMQHRKNVIAMLWPWSWKYWNDWSELTLWAWCNYEELSLGGCASAGKTHTITELGCLEWLAAPSISRLALTSVTVPSLRTRLWPEVMRFVKAIAPAFGANIVDSMTKIQYVKGDDQHAIQALAVDSGKIEDAIGKLQGVHVPRQIILVDEAAQTHAAIFSARQNLRTGTDFYRFAAMANPSSQYDAHGVFSKPKNGWGSITVDDEWWETDTGVYIHFDGLKSPNVKAGKIVVPRLFSQDDLDVIKKDCGENSQEWWMWVRGHFPPSGVRNTIVDAAMIQDGHAQDGVLWAGGNITTLAGLDPAFTTGGDAAILRLSKTGNDSRGNRVLLSDQRFRIQLEDRTDYPIFYQLADRTIEILNKNQVRPEHFGMDVTGAGAGLADIMEQRWKRGFQRISFGGSATDDAVSEEDDRPAKEVFGNRVSQLWGNMARLIKEGKIRGLDNETSQQLCTRIYSLKGEKQTVETKAEMKLRTKGKSPDDADAECIVGEVFLRNFGLSSSSQGSSDTGLDNFFSSHQIEDSYTD